ncbi:hypothetical protein G7Y89_g13628 [Cudoniella acicularis]|uniref:Uncharacterized protein n=1 Tax=Cudoniella acicularis TaxID=354080 RepID=A0A8H4R729_9HELO|nr:hypothetical protein G7Y89_g13628 [Cudoniella acicularis]
MLLSYLAIGIATARFLVHGAVLPASDVVVVSRGVNLTIPSPPPVFTRLVGTTEVATVGPKPDVTFNTGVITAVRVDCNSKLQFSLPTQAGTVEGTWTSFANMTLNDGTVHDVHFSRSGTILGIKAINHVYRTSASTKRQEYDDDDGTVGAYFWEDTNDQAWSDWQSTGIQADANVIRPYVYNNTAEIMCANLEDQDGAINAGVMTWGLNNDLVEQIPADLADTLAYCLAGDPDTP